MRKLRCSIVFVVGLVFAVSAFAKTNVADLKPLRERKEKLFL